MWVSGASVNNPASANLKAHEPVTVAAFQAPRVLQDASVQSASTCAPGSSASYADQDLGFRFRSENITSDNDGVRWNAVVPLGLAFTMRRPVDVFADENSAGMYSTGNATEPSITPPLGVHSGMHFESGAGATYEQIMFSNQKVAVGVANTFSV